MIPFGLSESQFVSRYRRELDRVSSAAIETFRSLLGRAVNGEVKNAQVEVFLDEDGGAPTVWIYYCGQNNKVDQTDQSLFPGRSLALQLPLSGLSEFDERYFVSLEDDEVEFPGHFLAGNTIKGWLAECWWKAGGWTYSFPTTLAVHDGWGDGNVIQLTEAAR
ncbi:hypothetical protein OU995_13990 [Roseateles sp. SL47]|uniref:hypothetical protein n=1 Tax=Roseateles sp. SL47 TaxID=2995138 RepID=UPI00226F3407|nr:hypothetical protein [Roseateles sp. SL47]WAC75728.1 hypothetical protein OU995_13990 [Roseateles sp. SL47]